MQDRKQHRQSRRHHRRQRLQRKAFRTQTTLKNKNQDILRNHKPCSSINISYPGMQETITCKAIRGKEARFNNRKRPESWLTPSARNLLQIHTNLAKRIQEFLPITNITIENNSFDFQKLNNQDIKSWQYSQGPLQGFKTYKNYINSIQHNTCLLCQKHQITNYHHIVPKHQNGSNTIQNIAGLCEACHHLVHTNQVYQDTLTRYKQGIQKQNGISLLNSTMPFIIKELATILPTDITTGYDTHDTRITYQLPKDHHIDAYIISISNNQSNQNQQDTIDRTCITQKPFQIRHFKKKSNNNIHKLGSRTYYLNNKKVATNRHKALEQKEPSLQEYLDQNTNTPQERQHLTSKLTVQPAKRIYTYHKQNQVLPFKCGDKIIRNKRPNTKKHTKREIYIIETIEAKKQRVLHQSGGEHFKYIKILQSRSLQFV